MERKNILLIIGIVIIAAGIFFLKRCLSDNNGCSKITYNISSTNIIAGESIHFEDNSPQSNEWKWEFGDGGTSELQSGDYIYKNAGDYTIKLTINGKCIETTSIKVADVIINHADTTEKQVTIIGPSSCYVGDRVQFNNSTPGASNWEWQFGESGSNDSREQNPSYMYNKPGDYTVVLRVDASKAEGRLKIRVMSKPAGSTGAPAPAKLSGDDLKAKLESISKGNFESEYYPMIKKFFCNNDNVSAVINGGQSTIYSYCMKLDIQRNTKIGDVQVEYDKSSGCISKVTITQK